MKYPDAFSERENEIQGFARQFEASLAEQKNIYLDGDDWADLANWYANHGKEYLRQKAITDGLLLHPDNTFLLIEKVYWYIDGNDLEKARETARLVTEDNLPEVKIMHADILLREGNLDLAQKVIAGIEDKKDPETIVDVVYMYLDMDYPAQAMEWIAPNMKQHGENEMFLTAAAECFQANHLLQEAASIYNKLIDMHPYSADYWYGLGRCRFEEQQYDQAIDACDYALIGDKAYGNAYLLKGYAFYQLGNETEAIANFQLAAQYQAVSLAAINTYLGLEKISDKKWEEGYEYLEKAKKSESQAPELSTIYANAALCLHYMKQDGKAHEYIRKAQSLMPQDATPCLVEGFIYLDNDQLQEAFSSWDKAVRIAPYPETWDAIGMYCIEHKLYKEARDAFAKIAETHPDFYRIFERLTILSLFINDMEAVQKYNRCCEIPFTVQDLAKLQDALKTADGVLDDILQYLLTPKEQ